ncbi:MAG TPA: hypothetical protein VG028_21945 [Terriglobia bacterium]|nr:hypothetical protein [Terriglobia bacterium]
MMANGNGSSRIASAAIDESGEQRGNRSLAGPLNPAWSAFVRYCQELRHGEIECLKIQDGLPVLAEVTKKKVKFT